MGKESKKKYEPLQESKETHTHAYTHKQKEHVRQKKSRNCQVNKR